MLRVFSLLGIAASALAVVSLIVNSAGEPLIDYLGGIFGGLLIQYQLYRDIIYSNIGTAVTTAINSISFLPDAPWFNLPAVGRDIVTVISIAFMSSFRGVSDSEDAMGGAQERFTYTSRGIKRSRAYPSFSNILPFAMMNIFKVLMGAALFFGLAYAEKQLGF